MIDTNDDGPRISAPHHNENDTRCLFRLVVRITKACTNGGIRGERNGVQGLR